MLYAPLSPQGHLATPRPFVGCLQDRSGKEGPQGQRVCEKMRNGRGEERIEERKKKKNRKLQVNVINCILSHTKFFLIIFLTM